MLRLREEHRRVRPAVHQQRRRPVRIDEQLREQRAVALGDARRETASRPAVIEAPLEGGAEAGLVHTGVVVEVHPELQVQRCHRRAAARGRAAEDERDVRGWREGPVREWVQEVGEAALVEQRPAHEERRVLALEVLRDLRVC